MIIYGNLLQQFDTEGSGRDDLGLGRWTYMRFAGEDRIVTRIIYFVRWRNGGRMENGSSCVWTLTKTSIVETWEQD